AKGNHMSLRNVFVWIAMICLCIGKGYGEGKEDLKKYLNDTAIRVKAASDPREKREILQTSFSTMQRALVTVQQSPLISKSDREAVARFESSIRDKQAELSGSGGYERVPDNELNAFAEYTVQEAEQAAETITISVVTLLLIIILVVLLVK
ncbi:MAG TPA: hypothetical protein VK470_03550, partial [Bacteroidota bacterium]|nr:hypothetical protein [Bacteroidota bacterium]